MQVRYTETALAEIEAIFSYIAERNPAAAGAVVDVIETTVARLEMFPESARATDEPGVRMVPAGRFPYLIFYEIAGDELRILRVIHGARLRPWEG